jgi:hypothetical protein
MARRTTERRFGKVVLYNVLVFFVVANVLYWLIPIGGALERFAQYSGLAQIGRQLPPGYDRADAAWLRTHWLENDRTKTVYRSYVGWRGVPSNGETINIEGHYGQRRTVGPGESNQVKVYFFGGSAMWGSGVDDARTIPSYFAAITGAHAENFGERAWVAHQNLMLLVQLLQAGHRPDVVVFYDGVNDVRQKCTIGTAVDAHGRERQFQANLGRGARPYYFEHYWAPLMTLAENIKIAFTSDQRWFECSEDESKAAAIAEALIRDWDFAKQLVEWHGGRFLGILQPVLYYSGARRDRVPPALAPAVRANSDEHQYRAVYPKLRADIARGGVYHDLVDALDRFDHVYVDWAHLAPEGNRQIAARIAELVASVQPRR